MMTYLIKVKALTSNLLTGEKYKYRIIEEINKYGEVI